MESMTEIEIAKIQVIDNSRTNINDKELTQLMSSIKQHGLEQPIGIYKNKINEYVLLYGHRRLTACKKLGWKTIPVVVKEAGKIEDVLTMNIIENLHRKDLTPYEVGRIVQKLQALGLTDTEIAVRLDYPLSRIQSCIDIFHNIPIEFQPKIKYLNSSGQKRNGNIPASVIKRVLDLKRQFKLNKVQTTELITATSKKELNHNDITTIAKMLDHGVSIKSSIKEAVKYRNCRLDVLILKNDAEKLVIQYKKPIQEILTDILYGEIEPIKRPKI